MAGFFVVSYLAFSVPPIVAGVLTSRFGLQATAAGYGMAAACLALCETGDEVVVLEPTYDSYQASIAMAGATPVFVTLRPPDRITATWCVGGERPKGARSLG